ncbi:cytidylyltransferase domain-containing protein [Nonlabens ulvanivorans]|uniref:cytidylyltransferase domain-containing protein n=1 Tax=Nonlabens ulvanivorans TaxID=906888 RepID=UPI0029428DD3|nr:hypothetical protein [Nonlabens ulvanivorans]WOI24024.1 hypothetical protein R1T42_06085 [Nonlabens ulvanivorans]
MDGKINKIDPVIIIQARMGSTRLPGKVMEKINGIPLIGYQIKRLQESQLKIVVAIPDNGCNSELLNYVQSIGVQTFEGDTFNVLKRFYDAALYFGANDIIRITGDNPLIDGSFIKEQVNKVKLNSNRYYFSEGSNKRLPLGGSFEMFSFDILKEAFDNAKSNEEFEHVTPYMVQNLPRDINHYLMDLDIDSHHIRLTIDTVEDLKLFKILIETYHADTLNVYEIIELFNKDKELLLINNNVNQIKVRNLTDEK